jgi:hypothetical protein
MFEAPPSLGIVPLQPVIVTISAGIRTALHLARDNGLAVFFIPIDLTGVANICIPGNAMKNCVITA